MSITALVRRYGVRVIRGTSGNHIIIEGEETSSGEAAVTRFHREAVAWATRNHRALLARLRC